MWRGWGASDGEQSEKRARVCFPDSEVRDSAWLIRKTSQEALVCSIPSSPRSLSFNRPFSVSPFPCSSLFLSFMISASHICTSSSQWKTNSMQRTSARDGARRWWKDTWAHTLRLLKQTNTLNTFLNDGSSWRWYSFYPNIFMIPNPNLALIQLQSICFFFWVAFFCFCSLSPTHPWNVQNKQMHSPVSLLEGTQFACYTLKSSLTGLRSALVTCQIVWSEMHI